MSDFIRNPSKLGTAFPADKLPFYSLTTLANTVAPWEKCLEYDVEF